MKKDLAIRALDTAVRKRQPPNGCLFHSDRGSQYRSDDHQAHRVRPSMSGKCSCDGNASFEMFSRSLQAELVCRQKRPTRRQAETAISRCIGGFYNIRRRHSFLGGMSLLAFEAEGTQQD